MQQNKTLGILGGMGPMASVYFYELLTMHTKASCDQDHLDILLSSHPRTPDRTSFIIGTSTTSPIPALCAQAQKLERCGANILAIACNTAHYFYGELRDAVSIPILHMPRLTIIEILAQGGTKVGILATRGTVQSGLYQAECEKAGLAYAIPSDVAQSAIMQLIYEDIKAGRPPRMELFSMATDELLANGCTHLLLGCTELSLLKRDKLDRNRYIDSMEVLAKTAILTCGKSPILFDF